MKALTTFVFFFLFVSMGLYAQATLSIQGTIQKSFGGAVDDGKYSLTFKLYTEESGGTPVWSETQDGVEVIGGVYSALLGAANPLNAGFNTVYYLGIAVDGGQELTPRTRLTSAPYALSLIGQSNTFPSAGSVGVGTVTPDAGASLHVHKADGHVQQIISTTADYGANLGLKAGDNHSGYLDVNQYAFAMYSPDKSINIIPTGNDGRVHLYGNGSLKAYTDSEGLVVSGRTVSSGSIYTQNGDFSSAGGVDLRLYRGGDRHILLRGDGYTEFNKCVYVPGAVGISWPSGNIRAQGAFFAGDPPNTGHSVSILANTNIAAGASFIIFSDTRIKKDLKRSDSQSDLATLMNLEVTDYRRRDFMQQGTDYQKGFIAQQVEKVFPEAVSTYTDVIPDIYTFPTELEVNGSLATFRLDSTHSLQLGDHVRIYQKDDSQQLYEVVRVQNDRSFTVKDWKGETEAENTFVFGKEVHDFRRVDYDRIHTLNVSATQELARRVAQLEAENAALRQQNGKMEGQIQGLRTQVDQMESLHARLSKLESLISSTVNR